MTNLTIFISPIQFYLFVKTYDAIPLCVKSRSNKSNDHHISNLVLFVGSGRGISVATLSRVTLVRYYGIKENNAPP